MKGASNELGLTLDGCGTISLPSTSLLGEYQVNVYLNDNAGNRVAYVDLGIGNGVPNGNFAGAPLSDLCPFGPCRVLNVSPAPDSDGDGVHDGIDNCVLAPNSDQSNQDADGLGDVCDPFALDSRNDFAQCRTDLAQCLAVGLPTDSDGDGEPDLSDLCTGTPQGDAVDQEGCSQDEFCRGFDAADLSGRRDCRKADWRNDEPRMRGRERDCTIDKQGKGRDDDLCVSAGAP